MNDPFLYARALAALLFVLALLGAVAYVARRFSGGAMVPTKRQRRLGIVEVSVVDPKRRLILVRRDETEHLLLVGGAQDLVVESGITKAAVPPVAAETVPNPGISPSAGRSRLDEVRF